MRCAPAHQSRARAARSSRSRSSELVASSSSSTGGRRAKRARSKALAGRRETHAALAEKELILRQTLDELGRVGRLQQRAPRRRSPQAS